MSKIIAVINQKGGVGKTTITANLGSALARRGFKVLLIDLDLQCNLSANFLGFDDSRAGISEYLVEKKPIDEDIILETKENNLWIIPSNANMVLVERALINERAREKILFKILSNRINDFDFILMDNSPSISTVTDNSLTVADYVLVPVSMNFFSMIGLKLLNEVVSGIVEDLNPDLKILGYVINQYDKRESITKAVEESIKEDLGDLVFKNVIRINTNIKTSPINQSTVFDVLDDKKGKEDFNCLTDELLRRINNDR